MTMHDPYKLIADRTALGLLRLNLRLGLGLDEDEAAALAAAEAELDRRKSFAAAGEITPQSRPQSRPPRETAARTPTRR